MADFTPITTQEQFDAAIQDRIGRAKDSVRNEFAGWMSPEDVQKKVSDLETQVSDLTGTINGLNEKIKSHEDVVAEKDSKLKVYETNSEKLRIAREKGLSYEAVELLQGDDKESIEKSADALKAYLDGTNKVPPAPNPEGSGGEEKGTEKEEALRKTLKGVLGE